MCREECSGMLKLFSREIKPFLRLFLALPIFLILAFLTPTLALLLSPQDFLPILAAASLSSMARGTGQCGYAKLLD